MDSNLYIQALLPIVVSILGIFIHKAIKTPNDSLRALALSKIAEGIAAVVIIQNPNATWATLIKLLVDQLKLNPSVPTNNIDALERAAAAALIASGAKL